MMTGNHVRLKSYEHPHIINMTELNVLMADYYRVEDEQGGSFSEESCDDDYRAR